MKKMAVKYLVLSALIFLSLVSKSQLKHVKDLGFVDRFEKLPSIKLESSSQNEFDLAPIVTEPIITNIKQDKSTFSLPLKSGIIKLKKPNDAKGNYEGYRYLGYYRKAQMFVITENTMSDNLSFGTLGLVDSLTGNYHTIVSIGNGAVETPISSPNGQYLIYYYNVLYNCDCAFIGLLKLQRKPEKPIFTEESSLELKDYAIENIKWLNEQTILFKVYS